MSGVLWVVGIPLAAPLAAAIPLMLVSTPWLIRINNWAIVGQIGLVLTSWLLLATLPDEVGTSYCREFDSLQGEFLFVVGYASFAVGGVA
jgi:hypothetical protein